MKQLNAKAALTKAKPAAGAPKAKTLAAAKRKGYYLAGPARVAANKKRTLARQLRRFPEDVQAQTLYLERYGKVPA